MDDEEESVSASRIPTPRPIALSPRGFGSVPGTPASSASAGAAALLAAAACIVAPGTPLAPPPAAHGALCVSHGALSPLSAAAASAARLLPAAAQTPAAQQGPHTQAAKRQALGAAATPHKTGALPSRS
jgi:hypothetical protein